MGFFFGVLFQLKSKCSEDLNPRWRPILIQLAQQSRWAMVPQKLPPLLPFNAVCETKSKTKTVNFCCTEYCKDRLFRIALLVRNKFIENVISWKFFTKKYSQY